MTDKPRTHAAINYCSSRTNILIDAKNFNCRNCINKKRRENAPKRKTKKEIEKWKMPEATEDAILKATRAGIRIYKELKNAPLP